MRWFGLAGILIFLCGASQGDEGALMSMVRNGNLPSFAQVLAAKYGSANAGDFAAFAEWSRKPTPVESVRLAATPCGFADSRAVAQAMARSIELSSTADAAKALWTAASAVRDLAERRSRTARSSGKRMDELAERTAVDQAWRSTLYERPRSSQEEEVTAWLTRSSICHVDADNTRYIKTFLARRGWPTSSKDGRSTVENAWTLVEHADADTALQKAALKMMPTPSDREDGSRYAALTDRIAAGQGEAQTYGTQFTTGPDGCLMEGTIFRREEVDERRSSIGLEPIAAAAAEMSAKYSKPLCHRVER